jgi:hydroxymethylglutaryl-CoA synthase
MLRAAFAEGAADVGAILSYGTYLPYWRLRREVISASLGGRAMPGTRAVASYDEDSTSMAVEAARRALRDGGAVSSVLLATTSPAYLDKANAAAVHAALDLRASVFAADMVGSVRSGVAALRAAATAGEPTLVLVSDQRTGLPGGTDERDGGDAAAAFVVGPGDGIADVIATASATVEILDRWRLPGELASRTWEERFGEPVYTQAAEQAFTDALKSAGLTAEDVDRLVVTGVHARAARVLRKALGVRKDAVVPDLVEFVGNTGAAHPGLLLGAVLDQAGPGELIALVVLSDGADVLLLRTTDALLQARQSPSLIAQLAVGEDSLTYPDFLTWRGLLRREPPRRPDPDIPMGPPALRGARWKFGLVGSRCDRCGSKFAPPQRVCLDCGGVDEMADERFADVQGTVRTFTVDRLAFTPNPPMVVAVIDVDGGGRIECEVTDIAGPGQVAVGDRLELTFRRLYTVAGVHNYFWKSRPVRTGGEASS